MIFMSNETKLYLVQGNIIFDSGDYIDDFCVIPGSSVEDVKREYFSRINYMRTSPISSIMTGRKVVDGDILDIRDVDLSSYGYKINIEKIVNPEKQ